ncbi:hypothetical protein PO883_31760 [Massilia sp. DJPM01]|uniref:hypothetical protein n=1 Tax=Massilia sp. DJPM01 TaxID=3024404 RepID=UPI00259E5BF5|nr:hypothetical protein [Massilia sp. DJPM01]MDM5181759.1 hypothetical protein [Massilia sp. DJPM01]
MTNFLKSSLLIAVSLFVMSLPAKATDAEICDIRAAILGSAAQERDKGVSKQKVKRMLGKKFSGMSGYIDLVYDRMKGMSPQEVAAFIKFSCSQE